MYGDKSISDLLDEIINKYGPYSQDQLTHAENVIENASNYAKEIKRRLIEAVQSLIKESEAGGADIDQGLYAFLESIGGSQTDVPKPTGEKQA